MLKLRLQFNKTIKLNFDRMDMMIKINVLVYVE
jgi:hypothetical protein